MTHILWGNLILVSAAALEAQDIVFERGNPSAYQTLQEALDAAQPGRRVLIRSSVSPSIHGAHGVIRKSVILEGQFSGAEFQLSEEREGLRVESLTSGLPLVIRNIQFSLHFGGGYHPTAIKSLSLANHSVILEAVAIGLDAAGSSAYWPSTMVSLQTERLTLRNCTVIAPDITSTTPCCGNHCQADGIDALRFTGNFLYLEDCVLRGGNASHMNWAPPSQCFDYLCPEGGVGGTGIDAGSAVCVAIRTSVSDGNGGSVGPGPWPTTPVAGHPRPSRFGLLTAYDLRHEVGRSDAGGPGVLRGQTVRYGHPDAPLSIGSARIGHSASVAVNQSSAIQPIAIALSTSLAGSVATLFGALHIPIAPPPPVLMSGVGITNLAVPNLPELVGQTLAGQLITLYQGAPFLSNPSVVNIGR